MINAKTFRQLNGNYAVALRALLAGPVIAFVSMIYALAAGLACLPVLCVFLIVAVVAAATCYDRIRKALLRMLAPIRKALAIVPDVHEPIFCRGLVKGGFFLPEIGFWLREFLASRRRTTSGDREARDPS